MSSATQKSLIADLQKAANKTKAAFLQGYFKTDDGRDGPDGEHYGGKDTFLGVTVPVQRQIARAHFRELTLADIEALLKSSIHEYRFTALEALVMMYDAHPAEVYKFYLAHTATINNWDLVDTSVEYIVGAYLLKRSRAPLYKLVRSKNIWERRMAIVATFQFIKNGDFAETLKIADLLMKDAHHLIHKAVGWMLREIGKRDHSVLVGYLNKRAADMPRTMLRYAIEHFSPEDRQKYLGLRAIKPMNRLFGKTR